LTSCKKSDGHQRGKKKKKKKNCRSCFERSRTGRGREELETSGKNRSEESQGKGILTGKKKAPPTGGEKKVTPLRNLVLEKLFASPTEALRREGGYSQREKKGVSKKKGKHSMRGYSGCHMKKRHSKAKKKIGSYIAKATSNVPPGDSCQEVGRLQGGGSRPAQTKRKTNGKRRDRAISSEKSAALHTSAETQRRKLEKKRGPLRSKHQKPPRADIKGEETFTKEISIRGG